MRYNAWPMVDSLALGNLFLRVIGNVGSAIEFF